MLSIKPACAHDLRKSGLTPRHRLRLAKAIVEDGWTVSYAAAVFNVAWPTANRWAQRYRTAGAAGMADRSSRPHRSPRRTPAPLVRKIVHLRWKKRLGPVAIARRREEAGQHPETAAAGATSAAPRAIAPGPPRRASPATGTAIR